MNKNQIGKERMAEMAKEVEECLIDVHDYHIVEAEKIQQSFRKISADGVNLLSNLRKYAVKSEKDPASGDLITIENKIEKVFAEWKNRLFHTGERINP